MKFTAINYFHNTECSVEVEETYEAKFGGMVSIVEPEELNRVAKKLCGIKNCQCTCINKIIDEDNKEYVLPY